MPGHHGLILPEGGQKAWQAPGIEPSWLDTVMNSGQHKERASLLECILFLAGIFWLTSGIPWLADTTGISRGVLFLIALGVYVSLFSLISWSLTVWRQHRRAVNESKKPCLHGVPGGETRDRCATCLKNREEENKRREIERQERQRIGRMKEAANSLRHEEMKRLAIARLSKRDFLLSGTPREFEDTVAAMFENLGYSVKQTPYSSDGGKDAIAMKDGKKVLIECKRYEKDLIGRPALQKFYAAIMEEKADKGIFVTTSGFARTALEYQYVRSNLIELVDGTNLADMMIRAFPESSNSEKYTVMCLQCGSRVVFDLLAGESRKMCPNNHPVNNDLQSGMFSLKLVSGKLYCDKCGREMRRVHGRRGDFWGCAGYPECRSTRPIQGVSSHE